MTFDDFTLFVQATGEQAYAEEVLERALYAFEMAWHPAFNPVTASCRLEFAHPPNRGFFVALFRHIQVGAPLCTHGIHCVSALETGRPTPVEHPASPRFSNMKQ